MFFCLIIIQTRRMYVDIGVLIDIYQEAQNIIIVFTWNFVIFIFV